MRLLKKITKILTFIIACFLFFNCEDDCTKEINIPKANPFYNPSNPTGNVI